MIRTLLAVFALLACSIGVANAAPRVTQTPIDCLTEAIVHETSGTTNEDRDAEGQLVLKRAADPKYPNSVCAVVHQKTVHHGKVRCQFSWYCKSSVHQKRPTKSEIDKAKARALVVWAKRDQARKWAIEFNKTSCQYDHEAYYLVKRTHAQCYLALKHKPPRRKKR